MSKVNSIPTIVITELVRKLRKSAIRAGEYKEAKYLEHVLVSIDEYVSGPVTRNMYNTKEQFEVTD